MTKKYRSMARKQRHTVMGIFVVLLSSLLLLYGCGSGGDSGSSSGGGGAPVNVAGTWNIADTNTGNTCGDPAGVTDNYQAAVTQNGGNISVVVSTLPGITFTGTINGNTVSWTGSYPEPAGGTTTITSMSLTASGNSLSGSDNWSWTDGVSSCTGNNSISGTKI